MDRNDETIKTYQDNFDKYIERTPQVVDGEIKEWVDDFLHFVPEGGEVFELGSAFGRDARYMRDRGYKVFCTDVIPQALEKLASEGFETASYDFRDKPNDEWKDRFNGVFANAVLLHAPREIFSDVIKNLLSLLKSGGVLAFSVKSGEGTEVSDEKMDAPRYYQYWSLEELKAILQRHSTGLLDARTTTQGKWHRVIAKKK